MGTLVMGIYPEIFLEAIHGSTQNLVVQLSY
jgi:hypothetical protein